MTDLTKPIERALLTFTERGRPVTVKITAEGIYMKQKGQRWSSAVLCPWGAAWSAACKIAAAEARTRRTRTVRRGLLSMGGR